MKVSEVSGALGEFGFMVLTLHLSVHQVLLQLQCHHLLLVLQAVVPAVARSSIQSAQLQLLHVLVQLLLVPRMLGLPLGYIHCVSLNVTSQAAAELDLPMSFLRRLHRLHPITCFSWCRRPHLHGMQNKQRQQITMDVEMNNGRGNEQFPFLLYFPHGT